MKNGTFVQNVYYAAVIISRITDLARLSVRLSV